jgi:ribosomal protein L11 methyltransferase
MKIIRAFINDSDVEALELYFFEEENSPWTLFQIRPSEPFFLQGYFPTESDAHVAYANLREQFPQLPQTPTLEDLPDADWQNAYKAFLKPWSTRNLHWVPLWQADEYKLPHGHVRIVLDAGMAFGTGAHETTRLCAQRIVDFYETHHNHPHFGSLRVVDAGCGSGILALSAAKLGFQHIEGFDIDEEAIRVSLENQALNNISAEQVNFLAADLEQGLKEKEFDLVIANILAPVLIQEASTILAALAPKGWLVLSGILTTEIEEVKSSYQSKVEVLWDNSFKIDCRTMGEWSDLRLVRL